MILHSLSGPLNLHQLTLDGLGTRLQPESERLWEEYEDKEVGVRDSDMSTLLEIAATLLFDPLEGGKKFSATGIPGWNEADKDWSKVWTYSNSCLVGVFVEARIDRKSASSKYEKLKCTELWDNESKEWNDRIVAGMPGSDRYSIVQLLGLLVEAALNVDGARQRFEALRTDAFYFDQDLRIWNLGGSRNSTSPSSAANAFTNLVGVLVEAHFDRPNARISLDKLRETDHWNKEKGAWRDNATGCAPIEILIQAELEKENLHYQLAGETPPLPILPSEVQKP